MAMIHGQTILIHNKTLTGQDPFGKDIFTETIESVDNVICEPASNDAIVTEWQMTGKKVAYILHIPKGDTHDWKDTIVDFNGESWKTYGDCLEWDASQTPLDWNKKVKVERYE